MPQFVCELEVRRNNVRSSQLSSSHSGLLFLWNVLFFFFFSSVILSAYQRLSLWGIYFFFPSVNFGNEMHLSKTAHGNTATDSTTVSYRQCSQWARLPLLPVRTKLRLGDRGLFLRRCLIVFFSFANLFYKCALLGLAT